MRKILLTTVFLILGVITLLAVPQKAQAFDPQYCEKGSQPDNSICNTVTNPNGNPGQCNATCEYSNNWNNYIVWCKTENIDCGGNGAQAGNVCPWGEGNCSSHWTVTCEYCGNNTQCWAPIVATPTPMTFYLCASRGGSCTPVQQGQCGPPPYAYCGSDQSDCMTACASPTPQNTPTATPVPPYATETPHPGCNHEQCTVANPHQCDQLCTCVPDWPGSQTGTCQGPPPNPTNTPVPPQSTPPPTSTIAPPTATPTTGACTIHQQCSNCNGDPAHCVPDCNGGWCNGGQCESCSPQPGGNGNCSIGKDCGPPRAGVPVTPGPPQSYWLNFPDKQGLCVQSAPRSPTWPVERCVPYTSPSPSPTATPIPATPTPVQPTEVISMIPTPTNNPQRPHPTSEPAKPQRWVCLKQEPCSDPASHCTTLDAHRVKLSVKTDKGDDAKPVTGKPTYVFECLQLGNIRKCTTGSETVDIQATGISHLGDQDVQNTGYQFGGFFYDTGSPAINPIPATEQNNGNFGVREWQSFTDNNIKRLFLAMNDVDANILGGDQGALQQGILALIQGGSKSCVQIAWDPYGQVLDKWTLKPVSGAQVLLYRKNVNGSYVVVTQNDLLNGIQNPTAVDQNGNYNFAVPDGVYKIEVKAPGYEKYEVSELEQNGKALQQNIKLEPQTPTIFDTVHSFIKSIIK